MANPDNSKNAFLKMWVQIKGRAGNKEPHQIYRCGSKQQAKCFLMKKIKENSKKIFNNFACPK